MKIPTLEMCEHSIFDDERFFNVVLITEEAYKHKVSMLLILFEYEK